MEIILITTITRFFSNIIVRIANDDDYFFEFCFL